MDTDKLYKDFLFWINGLIEDDPIPYEIKNLVFFVNKNYEIGFSGSENKIKKIDFYFYFPLEAEYFFNIELYSYIFSKEDKEKTALEILKNLLIKLKNEEKFKNYNFYYGLLFNRAKKL